MIFSIEYFDQFKITAACHTMMKAWSWYLDAPSALVIPCRVFNILWLDIKEPCNVSSCFSMLPSTLSSSWVTQSKACSSSCSRVTRMAWYCCNTAARTSSSPSCKNHKTWGKQKHLCTELAFYWKLLYVNLLLLFIKLLVILVLKLAFFSVSWQDNISNTDILFYFSFI